MTMTMAFVVAANTLGPFSVASASTTAFSFSGSAREPRWLAVNDGVMGGVSSGKVSVAKGVLRFAGKVRLENNGGFASTRSTGVPSDANIALANGNTVSIRVRGSGPTFAVTLQTDAGWFWANVTPQAGQWTTLNIPYARFLPRTRFGEPIEAASYAGEPTTAIGILIGNKRAEQFSIEIDSIAISQK